MADIDEGGPAFPIRLGCDTRGMTVRQWYAGQSLKMLGDMNDYKAVSFEKDLARDTFKVADAMIAEGKKPASWTSRELKLLNALKAIKKGYTDPKTMDGATSFEIADQAIDEAEGGGA